MKVLTVDKALEILQKAKEKLPGDTALVLSLTGSELDDVTINDMVVINDYPNAYVEVRATLN